MRALLYTFSILFTTLSHGIDRPLTDFFPLAQDAKHSNLLPDSLDHLQENTASPSLQDWGQAPSSRKLPEFRPDESRLKVFSALALGDDADDESKRLVKAEGYQAPATPDEEYDLGIGVFTALFGVRTLNIHGFIGRAKERKLLYSITLKKFFVLFGMTFQTKCEMLTKDVLMMYGGVLSKKSTIRNLLLKLLCCILKVS